MSLLMINSLRKNLYIYSSSSIVVCNAKSKYGKRWYFVDSIVFLPHGRLLLTLTCLSICVYCAVLFFFLLSLYFFVFLFCLLFFVYLRARFERYRSSYTECVRQNKRSRSCNVYICTLSVISKHFHCSHYYFCCCCCCFTRISVLHRG